MNPSPFDDSEACLFDSIREYELELLMSFFFFFFVAHEWRFKITACNHTLHIKTKHNELMLYQMLTMLGGEG